MTAPVAPQGPGRSQVTSPLERGQLLPELDPNAPSFGELLGELLGETSSLQDEAKSAIASYLRGDPVDLHDVMAAAQEATLSLELIVALRNKLTDAYRAVMNMQV